MTQSGRTRRWLRLLAGAGVVAASLATACGSAASTPADTIVVYRSPTCGCCSKWVQHLRDAGFTADVRDEPAMSALKTRLGIPAELASCHTATAGGYLIEGHVPAGDIRRLLAEKPKVRGLTAPGMTAGSPGMEMGRRFEPYEVLTFDSAGRSRVFAHHGTVAQPQ